ncbi:hypothetical protein AVEN_170628-1 [Araneus ventricosus]|uniref:Uncharacterized protein n=1 Tax=Araneus ventricosus TaxID=182803 RepID=A0A4Y2JH53_ARAVE|nr:hypothetical protein AVEN_170628-1 [Araneus ventricosus]
MTTTTQDVVTCVDYLQDVVSVDQTDETVDQTDAVPLTKQMKSLVGAKSGLSGGCCSTYQPDFSSVWSTEITSWRFAITSGTMTLRQFPIGTEIQQIKWIEHRAFHSSNGLRASTYLYTLRADTVTTGRVGEQGRCGKLWNFNQPQ